MLANAGAALAVGRLCVLLGLSVRSAQFAIWLSAFGSGALYSLFDCYTSDPLMYFIAPLMAGWLLEGRRVRATLVGCLGVLAKEFAAVPLWITNLRLGAQLQVTPLGRLPLLISLILAVVALVSVLRTGRSIELSPADV